MECQAFRSMIDRQFEGLNSKPNLHLEAHLQACESCAALAEELEGVLSAFERRPEPEVPGASFERMMARVHSDRQHVVGKAGTDLASRSPAPVQGPSRRGGSDERRAGLGAWLGELFKVKPSWGWRWAPVVALAGMVVVLMPEEVTRTKGVKGGGQIDVDLQMMVEHEAPDGRIDVVPALPGDVVSPQDGLLFRFDLRAGKYLLLMERSPEHHLRTLFERSKRSGFETTGEVLELESPEGQRMRYVPEGPPGRYVYVAVLSEEPFEDGPETLDLLWERYVNRELDELGTLHSAGLDLDSVSVILAPEEGGGDQEGSGQDHPLSP